MTLESTITRIIGTAELIGNRLPAYVTATAPSLLKAARTDGSRTGKGDHSDPTVRAVMAPDPIDHALGEADRLTILACRLLEDADRHLRFVETGAQPTQRENAVAMCCVCTGPCVPRAKSREGKGPLCEPCYHSWHRSGTGWHQWLPTRQHGITERTA